MFSNLLLVLGVAALSAGLRSFRHPVLFRLGTLAIVATSFLAGWLLGGNIWLGVAFAISWLFLPWLEILTRVRHLRLPADRALAPRRPPSRHTFPGFDEITGEVESQGFEHVEDTGFDDGGNRQFFRVFHHPSKRLQASICLIEQSDIAFFYISLTTRTEDGRTLVTWNYPFSYGLKLVPRLRMNRVTGDRPFGDLLVEHEGFLDRSEAGKIVAQSPDEVLAAMQDDLRAQISYNLDAGLLKKDGPKFIRYTVRGMFYLWMQFLRDLVRFF